MKSYPYNAEIMCNDYISLFEKLISNREEIVKARGNDLYYDSYIQRLVYLNSRKIMNR